ncbi:MAG: pirin family protein [Anaerolineae bacterium]
MEKSRGIGKLIRSKPTVEGAGVNLKRAFGFGDTAAFDPFLLLDDFRSDNPQHYLKGFPWHPHRGIETITYILEGTVEHGDSLGNQGVIGAGDVQWMTAGSGIIHQEMPKGNAAGRMGGFQLWANLPASHKMVTPRYRDVTSSQIPQISTDGGVTIRIICGEVQGVSGPVRDVITDPEYLDVTVPTQSEFIHATPLGHTVLAYVIDGQGRFAEQTATNTNLVLFDDGEQVVVSTQDEPVRFLLLSGKPIREPVAWYGPIVMNTQTELQLAVEEYNRGTFIKHKPA